MKKNKRGIILMVSGLCLLLGAGGITVSNRIQEKQGEMASMRAAEILLKDVIPEPPADREGYSTTATQIQSVELDGKEYIGVLSIPSLELSLPVMNRWSEDLLKESPCRYSGSYLDNSMIIAGHNYRRHFSGIKNMQRGEEVSFTDVNGAVYRYEVDDLEKIQGTDLKGMEAGEWDMTLFTCSYGGQDRIAVRCVLKD